MNLQNFKGTPDSLKNQHYQIPIRPGNSGEKSHSVDSTEIPIYLFIYFYLNSVSKDLRENCRWVPLLITLQVALGRQP